VRLPQLAFDVRHTGVRAASSLDVVSASALSVGATGLPGGDAAPHVGATAPGCGAGGSRCRPGNASGGLHSSARAGDPAAAFHGALSARGNGPGSGPGNGAMT